MEGRRVWVSVMMMIGQAGKIKQRGQGSHAHDAAHSIKCLSTCLSTGVVSCSVCFAGRKAKGKTMRVGWLRPARSRGSGETKPSTQRADAGTVFVGYEPRCNTV